MYPDTNLYLLKCLGIIRANLLGLGIILPRGMGLDQLTGIEHADPEQAYSTLVKSNSEIQTAAINRLKEAPTR